jgi:hypothetical protein
VAQALSRVISTGTVRVAAIAFSNGELPRRAVLQQHHVLGLEVGDVAILIHHMEAHQSQRGCRPKDRRLLRRQEADRENSDRETHLQPELF